MKTAITIPKNIFFELETARRLLKKSRSEIFSEALHDWLKHRQQDAQEKAYEESYRKNPDNLDDIRAFAKLSANTMIAEDWS